MINPNLILPECHVDTLLMNMVLKNMFEEGRANHKSTISEVAQAMRTNFKNRPSIGLVDDDRKQPKYFHDFKLIDQADGLLFKKHPSKEHYIIVISPVFEHWAFKTAKDLGINHKFKSIKSLKQTSKSMNVDKDVKVKDLLNSIIQKKGSPIKKMQGWIKSVFES